MDEGGIEYFLGIHVECTIATDGQVKTPIDSIITDLGLDAKSANVRSMILL
jgi:hypothetical protein